MFDFKNSGIFLYSYKLENCILCKNKLKILKIHLFLSKKLDLTCIVQASD